MSEERDLVDRYAEAALVPSADGEAKHLEQANGVGGERLIDDDVGTADLGVLKVAEVRTVRLLPQEFGRDGVADEDLATQTLGRGDEERRREARTRSIFKVGKPKDIDEQIVFNAMVAEEHCHIGLKGCCVEDRSDKTLLLENVLCPDDFRHNSYCLTVLLRLLQR